MSLLKRLSVTLFSRIDGVVADIENHDALIKVALEEQSQKIVQAKVQLRKLNRNKRNLELNIDKLVQSQQVWKARAIAESTKDQQRAMQCLQRKKQVDQEVEHLQKNHQEFSIMIDKLASDIRAGELELEQIKQKREMLSARQSSTEMTQTIHRNQQSNLNQLHETFDRWEANIESKSSSIEATNQLNSLLDDSSLSSATLDSFEKEYKDKEDQQALAAELAELVSQSSKKQTGEQG